MLVELHIEDLALLERASLPWGERLNVVTGETGAGKSLLIDALELLLGQRARGGLVRTGRPVARVEGRFVVAAGPYGRRVRGWLQQHLPEVLADVLADVLEGDAEGSELELILGRAVQADGKSRAHVNHRPVTQRALRELAAQLVEIHGQNDHQRLFDPVEQLQLIDAFAGLGERAAAYRHQRREFQRTRDRLAALQAGEDSHLQRLDLLRFQSRELLEASPSEEERDELVRERERLRHAERLQRELGGSLDELCEREDSALDALRRAEAVLQDWESRIEELATPASELRDAVAHTEEAVQGMRRFLDEVEADPERLDEVEERLSILARLERKYRTDLAGLESLRQNIESEIAQLEEWETDGETLRQRVLEQGQALLETGRSLAAARREQAPRLTRAVQAALKELGLASARFSVDFRERDCQDILEGEGLGPHGIEDLELHLAANPGERPGPLRKVASGGEMARIMLALRGALAVQQSTPTLIFDEVDTGVGGRLGPQVGAHLERLARHHQVLCVTHLPALAAVANHHLRVSKKVQRGRTSTQIEHLQGERRIEEIADMIAGGGEQETARAEARRLLEAAARPAPARPAARSRKAKA